MSTELTTDAKAAATQWPGCTHNGHDVFEIYLEDSILSNFIHTQGGIIDSGDIDSQECYLGYDPVEDVFYSAFDCWFEETEACDDCDGTGYDEDCDEGEEPEPCDWCQDGSVATDVAESFRSCVVRWRMVDGEIEPINLVEGMYDRMFYNGSQLEELHNRIPTLLDIRLD